MDNFSFLCLAAYRLSIPIVNSYPGMVGPKGIEPSQGDSQTPVLPLHHGPHSPCGLNACS